MVSNVMSELLCKDSPELESIVDRFLMILDSLLHLLIVFLVHKACMVFYMLQMLAKAAVISFDLFILAMVAPQ